MGGGSIPMVPLRGGQQIKPIKDFSKLSDYNKWWIE